MIKNQVYNQMVHHYLLWLERAESGEVVLSSDGSSLDMYTLLLPKSYAGQYTAWNKAQSRKDRKRYARYIANMRPTKYAIFNFNFKVSKGEKA